MRFLEATRGPGWWGDRTMQDYYADQALGADPFNWIRIHPLFPKGAAFPFDHAGKGETVNGRQSQGRIRCRLSGSTESNL